MIASVSAYTKERKKKVRVSDLKYKIFSNELRASSSIDIRGVACPAPSLRVLREEKWSPIGISHGRGSRAMKNNNNSREREGVKEENPAIIPIVFLCSNNLTSSAQFNFPVFKLKSGASTVPSFFVPKFSPLANFSATSATSSKCAPALTSSNPGGGGGATSFSSFDDDDIFFVLYVRARVGVVVSAKIAKIGLIFLSFAFSSKKKGFRV